MADIDYVVVNLIRGATVLDRADLEIPLYLSYAAAWPERSRTYTSDAGVAVDFADSRSPERRASAAVFSQRPAPAKFKIGRAANKPQMVYTIDCGFSIRNSYKYAIGVQGPFADAVAEYTSDANATAAEIQAGLVAALNGVAGRNYLAAIGSGTTITVTGTAAGDIFYPEVDPFTGSLQIYQSHADPGVAADLAAIAVEDPAFYLLYTSANSSAQIAAIEGWLATSGRIGHCDSDDSRIVTTALASGLDPMDLAKTNAYTRGAVAYHHKLSTMPGLGIGATRLVLKPGSETWNLATAKLVPPSKLTATHTDRIRAKSGNGIELVYGAGRFFPGVMPDGEWIDAVRGLDWLTSEARAAIATVLIDPKKTPYTVEGQIRLKNALVQVFDLAIDRGVIAALDPDGNPPEVVLPDLASIDPAMVAAREMPISATCYLAGAVHKGNVELQIP